MKARVRLFWLLGLFVLPLMLSGCGGLHATGSVSPIDFLLPGAGKLLHVEKQTPSQDASSVTNRLIAVAEPSLDDSASE